MQRISAFLRLNTDLHRLARIALPLAVTVLILSLPLWRNIENGGWRSVENPRSADNNNKKTDNSPKNSQEKSSIPDVLIGKKKLDSSKCYEGETVGDCAARMVQGQVSDFYVYLIVIGGIQAFAACASGFVAWKQSAIVSQQTNILKAQTDLAARAFDIDHRPNLVFTVDNFSVGNAKSDPFTIQCFLTNIGDGDALVTAGTIGCELRDPTHIRGDMLGISNPVVNFTILAGEKRYVPHSFPIAEFSNQFLRHRRDLETTFHGEYTYKSKAGRSYRIGFAWRLAKEERVMRFRQTKDAEENYSY